MTVDLTLTNAKIYLRNRIVNAGIAVNEEKVFKIAKETNLPKASRKIDLNGLLVLPGMIDVHTHLRDQKKAYKEDFLTGTSAAAAGGVTTVLDMPNNEPVTMDAKSLRERKKLAEENILVNVGFYSAFPTDTKKIVEIVREGAVSFKLFLIQQIGGIDINNDTALTAAFKEAVKTGAPVAVHAEDENTVEEAKRRLQKIGRNDIEAFLKAHSAKAEIKAVKRVINIAAKAGNNTHFCHVSTSDGLEVIATGKKLGLPVTCEVTPHHLLLSSKDLKKQGNILVTDPPLRAQSDVEALWKGLSEGTVDIIASDHAPHLLEEKTRESVWETKVGVPGLETTLPLMLTKLNEGKLALSKMVELIAENPARIFHLKNRGSLKEKNYADLVVVDPHLEGKVDASKFYSKAKYSPFHGWKTKGRPVKTFVNGFLVMDNGEIVAKPRNGRILG